MSQQHLCARSWTCAQPPFSPRRRASNFLVAPPLPARGSRHAHDIPNPTSSIPNIFFLQPFLPLPPPATFPRGPVHPHRPPPQRLRSPRHCQRRTLYAPQHSHLQRAPGNRPLHRGPPQALPGPLRSPRPRNPRPHAHPAAPLNQAARPPQHRVPPQRHHHPPRRRQRVQAPHARAAPPAHTPPAPAAPAPFD